MSELDDVWKALADDLDARRLTVPDAVINRHRQAIEGAVWAVGINRDRLRDLFIELGLGRTDAGYFDKVPDALLDEFIVAIGRDAAERIGWSVAG